MEGGFLPEGLKLFNPKEIAQHIGHSVMSVMRFNPEHGYSSDHEYRGAERALEEALYDHPLDTPIEPIKPWGLDRYADNDDGNRWDDMGDMSDRSL